MTMKKNLSDVLAPWLLGGLALILLVVVGMVAIHVKLSGL